MNWSGLAPELVWGLIPRFLGVLYIVAFGALSYQLADIIGVRGMAPLAARLEATRRDFPGVRRFFEFPTIFWFSVSDGMIRAVPWLGMLAGVLACYGGPAGYVGLFLGWLLWMSVEPAGLIFPWDTMLQEAGFFVLFLPLTEPLPSLTATALPLPAVAFMFRWLVLRLMLGFAKVKFIGTTKGDSMYLRGFLIWAPLPTPLAWWGHHAPRWFLRGSIAFMFLGEAIAPVLGFFSGPLRLVSFGIMTALMLGIHATGNWGYFNLGYIMLSVCLLDSQASLFDIAREPWASHSWHGTDLAINVAMAVLFFNSLVYFFVMNSWVTRTWVHWPWDDMIWNRAWARGLVAYFRALAPFHLTNGYGVFPPNATAPLRLAPVIEGSLDGKEWKPYGYKYLPTRPKSPLPVVAPHHPRFDQALHYCGIGIHDASFFSQTIGDGNPYLAYLSSCWLERAAQRLLLDEPEAKAQFGDIPFPDQPPTQVRVSTYAIAPTRPHEFSRTGERWRVRRVGTLIGASGLKPWIEAHAVPVPELFHFDFVHYKQRAQPLRELVRAYESGVDLDVAVLAASEGLSAEDVRRFWAEFVPALNEGRGEWSRLHERADAIMQQFGAEQLYRFERLMMRFAWLLRHRTEYHFVRKLEPRIALNSNYRYELLLQEIVSDGREATLAILADPTLAAARAASTTDETQLWTQAMMRYDMMLFHIRTWRWNEIGSHGFKYGIHGIWEFYQLLISIEPPDEVFRPEIIKHDDGEFSVKELYAAPREAQLPET